MPLVSMPNGEIVDVPDGISEEALNRIRAQYPARSQPQTRQQARQAGVPRSQRAGAAPDQRQQEVQRRARIMRETGVTRMGIGGMGNEVANRGLTSGITFGLSDEIAGGVGAITEGLFNAVRRGDIREMGRAYTMNRDVQREIDRGVRDESPIGSTIAEVQGAVMNPLGTGARGLMALGRGAQSLGLGRAATALTGTGTRLNNAGAMTRGAVMGMNHGALNAAGHSEDFSDMPGNALRGAALGGVTGGALGGVIHLGARGAQIVRDAMPANAQRTAYARIAQLLENGGISPQQAVRELQVANARGGDQMLMDLTPGLRAQAAAISRRPNVPSSNTLIERGEERILGRRERFSERVREDASVPPQGSDAFARADELQGLRTQAGQRDYAPGGPMDQPLNWSRDLDDFFRASPDADDLIRSAYTTAQRFGQPIGRIESGQAIPSMRAFDYLKREFDSRIGMALRQGNSTLASGLSNQLQRLKGILSAANPQYDDILRAQRDLFQQQRALELGGDVLKRMNSNPRQVLADLQKLPQGAQDDARVGIIDALINLDNKADPVAFFRSIARNDHQRKVLEFAFGGRREFRRFQRWVDREVKGTRSDVLTAPGRQSETSRIQMAADDEAGGVTSILSNAMRGYAFGGAVGLGSGVVRSLQNIASGTTRFAQEEIAKILMNRGDDELVRGVESANRYRRARERSNRRRAEMAGRAGQQMYTTELGGF